MIGSIIQVARDLLKSEGKNLEEWQEKADSAGDDLDETQKGMKEKTQEANTQLNQQPNEQPEEDANAEEKVEETVEEKVEEKPEEEDNKAKLLSDKKLKDIKSGKNKESAKDNSSGEETAGKVMGIVQGVRKEIANIGKALNKEDTQPAGSSLYPAIKNAIKTDNKYSSDVTGNVDSTNKSTNIASDERLKKSDECLKKFFYTNDDDRGFYDSDILDAYKNLQTITFTYKPEAAEIDPTQDTETVHVGLKAQDIEAQPELASAVKEDPESGYKMVDTREMTMQNAAAISEIAKLLDELKDKIKQLGG